MTKVSKSEKQTQGQAKVNKTKRCLDVRVFSCESVNSDRKMLI